MHGSDSAESAEEEIKLFFNPEQSVDYKSTDTNWLYWKQD
ncbi:MAG: hypothetical protein ACYTBJ_04205 [Planctomycetota bacterium]